MILHSLALMVFVNISRVYFLFFFFFGLCVRVLVYFSPQRISNQNLKQKLESKKKK